MPRVRRYRRSAPAQALGPLYGEALQADPGNPDHAFDQALTRAGSEGLFSGIGWAAFGVAPFKSMVKDLLVQTFGVQPVVAAAGAVAQNVEAGRPATEGVADTVRTPARRIGCPDLLDVSSEVLPDPKSSDRILLARPYQTQGGSSSNQVAVVELALKGDGLEIVSLHVSPDRTLAKARKLAEENGGGAGGAAVPSYGGSETPAAADFPTVGTTSTEAIGSSGQQDKGLL